MPSRRRGSVRPTVRTRRMFYAFSVISGVSILPFAMYLWMGHYTGSGGTTTAPFSDDPRQVWKLDIDRPRAIANGTATEGQQSLQNSGSEVAKEARVVAAFQRYDPSGGRSTNKEYVVVQTKFGNITMLLRADKAPKHVEYMKTLIQAKRYDGCCWYRAEKNFVLQGGLRTAAGRVISADLPSPPLEYALPNKRGFVNMARWEDPNSAGGDFCVLLKDSPHLDRSGVKGYAAGFTVWAEVVAGMDVADRISLGETKSVGGLNILRDAVRFDSVTLQ